MKHLQKEKAGSAKAKSLEVNPLKEVVEIVFSLAKQEHSFCPEERKKSNRAISEMKKMLASELMKRIEHAEMQPEEFISSVANTFSEKDRLLVKDKMMEFSQLKKRAESRSKRERSKRKIRQMDFV